MLIRILFNFDIGIHYCEIISGHMTLSIKSNLVYLTHRYVIYNLLFIFRLPFFKIIVPTIDTVRYNYLVERLMNITRPVLLVGPVGTGKTSTVQKVMDHLDKKKFLLLTINMSARTTSNNVQETIEERLEKRGKDLFVPQGSAYYIIFQCLGGSHFLLNYV